MNNENLIQLIYDDIQEMKRQQVETNERLDSLESRVMENTEGIRRIDLCLENEIRPSIMRIAEGHLDLSRKLNEALKIDEEKEKMAIRLNFLEGKVDRLEVKVTALT